MNFTLSLIGRCVGGIVAGTVISSVLAVSGFSYGRRPGPSERRRTEGRKQYTVVGILRGANSRSRCPDPLSSSFVNSRNN